MVEAAQEFEHGFERKVESEAYQQVEREAETQELDVIY